MWPRRRGYRLVDPKWGCIGFREELCYLETNSERGGNVLDICGLGRLYWANWNCWERKPRGRVDRSEPSSWRDEIRQRNTAAGTAGGGLVTMNGFPPLSYRNTQ